MSHLLPLSELPVELSLEDAVEAAYARPLADVAADLARGLPVLLECDKELAPYVYLQLRARLRREQIKCVYLDGRPREGQTLEPQAGFVGLVLSQLRDAVRGALERRVIVLPHLDLLAGAPGGLTTEAREVVPLLYENPDVTWLAFRDPSLPLPRVVENLFAKRHALLGVPRERLRRLVTQREARKFGREFNPWGLYKFVSGMNPVRLRKLLAALEGEDYPADPRRAFEQIRQATAQGALEIPHVDLEREIGGYARVKARLRAEILDVLAYKDQLDNEDDIERLEELLPKGLIFWGPPGTGKTLFAKAFASAIGAAVTVVSGPELKSRWVGESEERLRRIFHQARQAAPAIIVFDELDSFASARGVYTGSGVEHSMVNQLLTEMDGFHRDELVFVVGVTNFVEILDPALLRPGRFEFLLHVPPPDAEDRREILRVYNDRMRLRMTAAALEHAARRSGEPVEGAPPGTRFTGDHLHALCRALARLRLRDKIAGDTTPELVERALTEWHERPKMTPAEERVVATHEAGHAVCALCCPRAPAIERVSIRGDAAGALGFVRYQDPAHQHVVTRDELLDVICVLLAGREAEALLLGDLSIGAARDLERATAIAAAMVREFGMGGETVGPRHFPPPDARRGAAPVSPGQLEAIDVEIRRLLEQQRRRAQELLRTRQSQLEALRDLLLRHKTLEAADLRDAFAAPV